MPRGLKFFVSRCSTAINKTATVLRGSSWGKICAAIFQALQWPVLWLGLRGGATRLAARAYMLYSLVLSSFQLFDHFVDQKIALRVVNWRE